MATASTVFFVIAALIVAFSIYMDVKAKTGPQQTLSGALLMIGMLVAVIAALFKVAS